MTLPLAVASILTGIGTAQAVDIKPAVPAPCATGTSVADCNRWFGGVTATFKRRDTGSDPLTDFVIDLDFLPPPASGTSLPFTDTTPTVQTTFGIGNYSVNSGVGAFDGFESSPAQIKKFRLQDIVLPGSISGDFESYPGPIFAQLDPGVAEGGGFISPAEAISPGLGPDYYYLLKSFAISGVDNPGGGSTVFFTTNGTYKSGDPSVPDQDGNLVFTTPFSGTFDEFVAQLFAPGSDGFTDVGLTVTGTLVPAQTPEPTALFGLATVAGSTLLLKRKRSKN